MKLLKHYSKQKKEELPPITSEWFKEEENE